MIEGHATLDGTGRFSEESVALGSSSKHFRRMHNIVFSSLGMGTYLGPIDIRTDRQIEEAVKHSINTRTINVIDTAINYRFQRSERAIGRALVALFETNEVTREQIFVSTKNGYLAPDADHPSGYRRYIDDEFLLKGIIKRTDIIDSSHCMTIPFLEHELKRSLANLQLETLDLIYLHNSAEAEVPFIGREKYFERLEEIFSFYEDQRRKGTIRFYGLATWDCFRNDLKAVDHLNLTQIIRVAEKAGGHDHGFRFIQFPFNLAMPEALTAKNQSLDNVVGSETSLIETCIETGVGAFTSVPLMQGRLIGHPGIPSSEGMTKAQSNLQFARSIPGIIAPLVGQKNIEHVLENIEIAKMDPLTGEELKRTYLG